MNEQEAAAARRVRRVWIREHHPDRGGDPARFAQGLQQHEPAATSRGEQPDRRPTVVRTRKLRRTVRRLRRRSVGILRRINRRITRVV